MKTKIRKPSELTTCEICGKSVFKRGIKSHIRLQHKLKITETTKVIESATKVNSKNTQVKETIQVVREYKPLPISNDPVERRREYLSSNKIVSCCRCGNQVKVADISESAFYRIRNKIACEYCIKSWYVLPEIVYAIQATTYDSKGDTVSSRIK